MRLLPLALFLLVHAAPAAQPSPTEVEAFLVGAALDLRVEQRGGEEALGVTLELLPDGTMAALDPEDGTLDLWASGWQVARTDGATLLSLANVPPIRVESLTEGRLSGSSTEGSEVFHLVETGRVSPSEEEGLRAGLIGAWVDPDGAAPLSLTLSASGALAQSGPFGDGSGSWDLLPALRHLIVYPDDASGAARVGEIYREQFGRGEEPRLLHTAHAVPVEAVEADRLRLRLHGARSPALTLHRATD